VDLATDRILPVERFSRSSLRGPGLLLNDFCSLPNPRPAPWFATPEENMELCFIVSPRVRRTRAERPAQGQNRPREGPISGQVPPRRSLPLQEAARRCSAS